MLTKVVFATGVLVCGGALAMTQQAAQQTGSSQQQAEVQQQRKQHGDVFLIQKVHQEQSMHLPTRGMSMAQVKKEFGAPIKKLPTRGGHMPDRPPINRWVYKDYTVYFERHTVLHSVLKPPASDKRASQSTG